MKMKRLLSILLSAVLLFSLLPGMAVATEGPALPEGCSQLYARVEEDGGYVFKSSLKAPPSGDFCFTVTLEAGGGIITSADYDLSCDEKVGSVSWENTWTVKWSRQSLIDGNSGYIYATAKEGGVRYALPVSIKGGGSGPSNTPTLPDGFTQMYAKGVYNNETFSNLGQPAGGEGFGFVPTTEETDNVALNLSQYTFSLVKASEGPSIGSVTVENGEVVWSSKTAYPGFSGWILAEPNNNATSDEKYAIRVTVNPPMFGVYDYDRTDLSSPANGYIPRSEDGPYVVNYNQKGRTVYIVLDEGKTIPTDANISVTDGNGNITAVRTVNGNIAVTLNANFKGRVVCTIGVPYVEDSESGVRYMDIEFTDGSQGGGNQTQGPALPDGYSQMYFPGLNGAVTELYVGASTSDYGNLTSLAVNNVPLQLSNYNFSLSNNNTGKINYAQNDTPFLDASDALPGSTGWLFAVSQTDANVKYAIHVTVNNAPVGVYTGSTLESGYLPCSGGRYTVPYANAQYNYRAVYVIPGYDNLEILNTQTHTAQSDNKNITVELLESGALKISLADSITTGNHSAVVTFSVQETRQNNGQNIQSINNWTIWVSFTDGSSTPNGLVLVKAESAVTDETTYDGVYSPDNLLASFTLGNTTYYMAVCGEDANYPNSNGSVGNTMAEDDVMNWCMEIGFFVKERENEYTRVRNSDTLAAIYKAFGDTFSMSVLSYKNPPADWGFTNPAATLIPATYVNVNKAGPHLYMEMMLKHNGVYVIVGEGTIGETTLRSEVTFEWDPRTEIPFRYNADSEVSFISQLNTFLMNLPGDTNYSGLLANSKGAVRVDLPEGTEEGYIEIPAALGWNHVNIYGVKNGSENKSTIKGGIINNNGAVHINNVNFVGAGGKGPESGNAKEWTSGVNDKKDNIALSGIGISAANGCKFSGYDIAINNADGKENGQDLIMGGWKTSQNCQFENNNTAILLGTITMAGGNSNLSYNTFVGNGIALHFKQLNDNWSVSWFDLKNNCFINNEIDVRNDLNHRNIFMPGCYFADEGPGGATLRECRYLPEANGSLDKQVLYYPQATSRACNEFQYSIYVDGTSTRFYKFDPVVSVHFTQTYPIPAGALDGVTFHTKKNEEYLARISFAQPKLKMFRMTRNDVNSFDATVEVDRSEDGKTITITTQAFPSGKTATISVPCDETWKQAEVTAPDSSKLEATVEGGYVSFTVSAGGTFVITETSPVTPPAPVDPPVVTPSAPSDSSQTVTNPDGSTTTSTSTAEGSGTVTEQPDGSIAAEAKLSATAVAAAAAKGESVTLPIAEVAAGADAESAPVITVNTGSAAPVRVEIPVAEVSNSTVAILVLPDGSEKIVPNCVPTEGGVALDVADGAVVKVVDNAVHFDDVHTNDHWGEAAVDFAASRRLLQGVGGDSFSPDTTTTRGMVFTVLARYADQSTKADAGEQWFTPGTEWAAASGISDGSNPGETVTREQIVTMLWRYAGAPAATGDVGAMADADEISSWAAEAMRWAVSVGLIHGRDGNTVAPKASATRAEFAQMLYKFCVM